MSVAQVGKLLGVTVKTVPRWDRAGAFNLGGSRIAV